MRSATYENNTPGFVAPHRSRMAESSEPQSGQSVGTDRAHRADAPPMSAKVSPGHVSPGALRGKAALNILIAEDNFANQLIAKTLLIRARHTVTAVDNGYQAAGLCEAQPFNLILMDIEMPEMSGIEATEIIRETTGPNAQTLIIALTAFGSATERYVYRHSGINHVLSKPFKIE